MLRRKDTSEGEREKNCPGSHGSACKVAIAAVSSRTQSEKEERQFLAAIDALLAELVRQEFCRHWKQHEQTKS